MLSLYVRGQAVSANPNTADPNADLLKEVDMLVRSLVSVVESMDPAADEGEFGTEDQILLDVEVGDVRCLMVRHAGPSPMALLSPREREIARMVAQGYPNKTIASVLDISTWTVSSHLRRIFTKLHVSSRTAMATRLSFEHLAPGEGTTPADSPSQEYAAR
jgi:DNA-binding CsgD family transcriptional regulator